MDVAGWITLGTKISDAGLKKDLIKIKKELEQSAAQEDRLLSRKEKLELQIEIDQSKIDTTERKIADIKKSMEKAVPGTNEYSTINDKLTKILEKNIVDGKLLEQKKRTLSGINSKLVENAANQDILKNKYNEIVDEINPMKDGINNVGESLLNTIKSTKKWILALFSVRSIISVLSNAMSTLAQYNSDLANKINGIKITLASALEPVVSKIINVIYTLVGYMSYISDKWFDTNLMAGRTAKNLKSGVGYAKEMRKTLAGFDEMNILNDNVSASSGVSGGSDLDFSGFGDVKIPDWIKTIADNKDAVLTILKGFGIIFGAIKIGQFLAKIGKATKGILGLSDATDKTSDRMKKFSASKTGGIALMVIGLATVIGSVTNLIQNWDTMTTKEKVITGFFTAVGVAAIALGTAIAAGISAATLGIGALLGIIAALITALANLAIKELEEKSIVMDNVEAKKKLKEAQDNLNNTYLDYANKVDRAIEAEQNLIKVQQETNISADELIKKMEEEGLTYKDLDEKQKQVYKAYYQNIKAQEDAKQADKDLVESKKAVQDATWDEMRTNAIASGNWDEYKNAVITAFENGELKADEARDLIEKAMKGMSTSAQVTFGQDMPKEIKEGLNPTRYQTTWDTFKNNFLGVFDNIKWGWKNLKDFFGRNKITASVSADTSGMKTGGIVGMKTGGIIKLASGALVNNPGRGVPIASNVYAGESGAEGVIPLTDYKAMSLLGKEIGKNITIYADIVNSMNGRVISRELKKIENNGDFAYNR